MNLAGRWRIVAMDTWDQDAIDLAGPGFIEFAEDGTGQFGLIAVRGWAAQADDGTLDGHLFFHLGDDSAFHAVPFGHAGDRDRLNVTTTLSQRLLPWWVAPATAAEIRSSSTSGRKRLTGGGRNERVRLTMNMNAGSRCYHSR